MMPRSWPYPESFEADFCGPPLASIFLAMMSFAVCAKSAAERKNHEKYSAEVSTAMRNCCETRCGGGGLSSLTHQTVNMRMKIDAVAKGLDAGKCTRANPHFGLPQSRERSTTSLMTGRKNPYSFWKRLSYSARNLSNNGRAHGRGRCAPDVETDGFLPWQEGEFKK